MGKWASNGLNGVGAVLGIDVGFSERAQTTNFCLLTWSDAWIAVRFAPAGSSRTERLAAFHGLASGLPLDAVAIDGPLTRGLRVVPHYRSAEALLSRGLFRKRGKPGQTNSPSGQQLHHHATQLAGLVIEHGQIAAATHSEAIHSRRVVEAFPNAFLAVLTPEDRIPEIRRDATDKYWGVLVDQGDFLVGLLNYLLRNRESNLQLRSVQNHEERGSFVCALTALCAAADLFVAVGDPDDGDIILPPLERWGATSDRTVWAETALLENLASLDKGPRTLRPQVKPRIRWEAKPS